MVSFQQALDGIVGPLPTILSFFSTRSSFSSSSLISNTFFSLPLTPPLFLTQKRSFSSPSRSLPPSFSFFFHSPFSSYSLISSLPCSLFLPLPTPLLALFSSFWSSGGRVLKVSPPHLCVIMPLVLGQQRLLQLTLPQLLINFGVFGQGVTGLLRIWLERRGGGGRVAESSCKNQQT